MTTPSRASESPRPASSPLTAASQGRRKKSKPHTARSATILLMVSSLLSGVLALVRIKYVNYIFGAGVAQDAYRAAFGLPDLLNYFLIGGAASISLITILNRYREAGDEDGGDRALSVILTTMLVVLGLGVVFGEILAPQYVWLANKGFRTDPERAALCVSLTRLLLPAQLFFFIGSVMSSRLQVRKIFIYQALTPLIYNGGIILGAVLLHRTLGIYSLAWGVLFGVVVGSALLNSIGAFRLGLNFRAVIGFRHPAFLEWLRLSLPLMIGISLVMFDRFFLSYFASTQVGGITLILNAKDLFNAPFNVIGPAAGAASLPFFASLYQQKRRKEFSESVGNAVTRLFAVGLFVSAWMIALAPWLMDLLKGGKFNRADTADITRLFVVFAATLAVWAVQGIFARAFYAASDTKTPAIVGTLIVVLSAPMYWAMFRWKGLSGLTIASDIGIVAQTFTLALLLAKKRLMKLTDIKWLELLRCVFAAVVACAATSAFAVDLPQANSHSGDIVVIFVSTVAWLGVVVLTLLATRSELPAQMLGLPPKDAPQ